jgi:hypothetical protein
MNRIDDASYCIEQIIRDVEGNCLRHVGIPLVSWSKLKA